MLGYDTQFAALTTREHIAGLRESYAAGRVPYRSDNADRDSDEAARPILAPTFGAAGNGCHPNVSQRAA